MLNKRCSVSCAECSNRGDAFKSLSELEMALIEAKKVVLNYRKGEVIAKQGSYVSHVLYLQKGLVKIYSEINSKDNIVLNIFPSGNLIGLPSLFGSDFMQYSVAALEETTICAIEKKVIEELIHSNGVFAASIIRLINRCTVFNFEKFISFSQKQMNGRLAELLLYLADSIFYSNTFPLSLTRKDMAEFTGMSIMSVVRGLKDFKESGFIDEKENSLTILNRKALEKICQVG